ncbi:MAG TPA: alpha-ketoacid dehydrogenase subunit beta [Syntrophomonas sp.]|nr:alpha-ketoacid dehydrogenase subunit beta [Syntrophomonas sp.]
MKKMNYGEAIAEAMLLEMRKDPTVFLLGEDVGLIGGGFGASQGLYAEFGRERVIDSPISETAIIGAAVGAAAVGLRPIAELMFVDFIGVALDEILNQAAKMRYMFGGKAKVPMVMRAASGAGMNCAAQHSQSLEATLTHIPGIKVIMPSTPADAKGLLTAAIRDDNPVMFLEHKMLYGMKGDVPEGEYVIPIGKADIKRAGSDVTIVTWSLMVHKALAAAETLSKEGISAEVLDLRTLSPLDTDAIFSSIRKTGRLVIVHESVEYGGFGGEIAALVADECFDLLNAPIKRVAAPFSPVPYSPALESEYVPNEDKIIKAVKELF